MIDAAAGVQRALVDVVTAVGPGGWALLGGGLLVATGGLLLRRRGREDQSAVTPAPTGSATRPRP